jgi:hypothetical protein
MMNIIQKFHLKTKMNRLRLNIQIIEYENEAFFFK